MSMIMYLCTTREEMGNKNGKGENYYRFFE